MMDVYNHPRAGKRMKGVIASIVGTEPELIERLASEEELSRAAKMSFEDLAAEALEAKHHD